MPHPDTATTPRKRGGMDAIVLLFIAVHAVLYAATMVVLLVKR